MTTSLTTTRSLSDQLELVEVKPGLKFSKQVLIDLLPDAETALFFSKVYELNHVQVSRLLATVLNTDLSRALFNEGHAHSMDLQDYIVDDLAPAVALNKGDITFNADVPKGEILPEVWKSMEVEIADSIKAVASKLEQVFGLMPGKQGKMVFQSMAKLNAKRPTIGDYRAKIQHERQTENLLILDVSGSVNADTVSRIINDVVSLSYMANAHMAVVSNTTTHWDPGTYSVDDVLDACEYGGTHYETLRPLLDRDWGVVICIADYDSSYGAKAACAKGKGSIEELFDVSIVGRPTFLAECVGQKAKKVTPMLVSSGYQLH